MDSVLDSVEGIAAGGGGGVPALIENSLAKAVPVVLDFLASLLGLGGISEKIKSILAKVQAPVMKVVDWVIAKIVAAGKKLLSKLKAKAQGGDDTPEGKQQRLDKGMAAARAAANKLAGRPVGKAMLAPVLAAIKARYGLVRLEAVPSGKKWAVEGEINPKAHVITDADVAAQARNAELAAEVARFEQQLAVATAEKSEVQGEVDRLNAQIQAAGERKRSLPAGPERTAAERAYKGLILERAEAVATLVAHGRSLNITATRLGDALDRQKKESVASYNELANRLHKSAAMKKSGDEVLKPHKVLGTDFLGTVLTTDPNEPEHVFPRSRIVRLTFAYEPPGGGRAEQLTFLDLDERDKKDLVAYKPNLVALRKSVNIARSNHPWADMGPMLKAHPGLAHITDLDAKQGALAALERRMEAEMRAEAARLYALRPRPKAVR